METAVIVSALTIPAAAASLVTMPMGIFGAILISRFKYGMDHDASYDSDDDSKNEAIESSTANMLNQMPSAPKNTDSLVVDVPHMPSPISAPKSAPKPEMELRSHYQPS